MSRGAVPHVNIFDAVYDPTPEFGGGVNVIYRSPDGLRVAAAFKESGTVRFRFPYDEFIYVVSGRGRFEVGDGQSFELTPGHACYFRTGQTVTAELSDDYHAVVVLTSSDDPIDERVPSLPDAPTDG